MPPIGGGVPPIWVVHRPIKVGHLLLSVAAAKNMRNPFSHAQSITIYYRPGTQQLENVALASVYKPGTVASIQTI